MMRKLGQKGKRGLSLLLVLLFCLAPIPFNFNFTPKVEASWPEGDVITNYPFNPGVPPATVEDLAWDVHNHPMYDAAYTQALSQSFNANGATEDHIVFNGKDIDFFGYWKPAYMDYIFVEDMYENYGNAFIMRPVNMNFHTFSETGYLFNGTMVESGSNTYYTGYALVLQCNNSAGMQENDASAPNTAALRLYYIKNELWNTESFKPGNVLGTRELIATFKTNINNFDSTPFRVNVEIDPVGGSFDVYIDGDHRANVVVDSGKMVGNGFGFYTGYFSHSCSMLTRIRYEDVTVSAIPYEGEAGAEVKFLEQGTGKVLRAPEYKTGEFMQKYKVAQPKKIEFEGKIYYLTENSHGASVLADIVRIYTPSNTINVTELYYVLSTQMKSMTEPDKNSRVNGGDWNNGASLTPISITEGDEIEYNTTVYSPPLPEPAMMTQGDSDAATTSTWFKQPSLAPAIQKQQVVSLEFVDLPEGYSLATEMSDAYSDKWEEKPIVKIWDASYTVWNPSNPTPRVFAWVTLADDGINYNLFIGAQRGVLSPINIQYFLCNFTKLKTVALENLDTSNVTNMWQMFYNCTSLTELDLSGIDTSNVTTMAYIFYNCSSLTNLDLSPLDTSNVTDMSFMFQYCAELTNLDLSPLDTSNVVSMAYMFAGCSNITNLDLSVLNTSNVASMANIFSGCKSLKILNMRGIDLTKITTLSAVFAQCTALEELDLSDANLIGLTTAANMFSGRTSLKTVNLSNTNMPNITSTYRMFYGCTGLINLDLYGIDTSNVNNMSGMFNSCTSLTNLDLNGINTSSVTTMANMFYGCNGLTALDLIGLDTSRVTDMSGMFYNCTRLTALTLSGLDTSSVTDMSDMFYNCSRLTALDLSGLDTSSVTTMASVFYGCSGLTDLDISSLDTSNVTTMTSMFQGCTSLTDLDLSAFNTSNVTNMSNMFVNCTHLANLDLSGLNTSSVTNMTSMFNGCSSLTDLDLSELNTSNVTSLSLMFYNCTALTELHVETAIFSSATSFTNMFYNRNASLTVYVGNAPAKTFLESLTPRPPTVLLVPWPAFAPLFMPPLATPTSLSLDISFGFPVNTENGNNDGDIENLDTNDMANNNPFDLLDPLDQYGGFTPTLPPIGIDPIDDTGYNPASFQPPMMLAGTLTGTVTITDDVPIGLLIDPTSVTTGDGITHTIVGNLITWEIPVEMLPVDLSYKVTVLSNTTGTKYENTATATYKGVSATSNATYHEYSASKLTVTEQYYIFGTTTELDEPNITVYDGTNTHSIKGSLSNLNGYEYCGYEIDGGGYINDMPPSPMTLTGSTTITLYYKPVSNNPTVTIYFVDSTGNPLKDYIFQAVHNNSDWYIPQSYMAAIDTPTGTWTYYGFKLTEPSEGSHETPGNTPMSPITKDPDGLELPIFADITDDVAITLYFAKQAAVTVRFVERGNESNILKNTETYFGSTTPDTSAIDLTEENGKEYTYSGWYSVDGGPEQYGDPGLITGSHEITLFFETHYTVTEYFVSYVRYINDENAVEIYIDSLDDPAEHDNIAQGTPFQGNPQSFPGYTYIGYCFDNGYNEIYEGEPDPFDVYGDTVIIYLYSKDYVPIYTPTIDKNIIEKSNKYVKTNTYAIGDIVSFMLQIELPDDLDEYLDYTLIVHDEFGGTAADPYISYDLTGTDYLDAFAVYTWDGLDPATKNEFLDYTLTMMWPTFDVEFGFLGILEVPEGMSLLIEYASAINQSFEAIMETTNTTWLEYTDDKTLGTIDVTDNSTVWFATSKLEDWWKIDGDTANLIGGQKGFVKIADPDELPTGAGVGTAYSTDGHYLAIAHYTSPFVTIYDLTGDVPIKIATPDVPPTGIGAGAAFSPDGHYLAIAHINFPFVTIYDMTEDIPTKISDPNEFPTGAGQGAAFSPDGHYLVIAHEVYPYVAIYDMTENIPTKIANPDILPTGNASRPFFSSDGHYLVLAHLTSPFVTIYDMTSEVPTKIEDPNILPTGMGTGAPFSPNDQYLAVSHFTYPYITLYDMTSGVPIKTTDPDIFPTGNGRDAAFSPDGHYLVVAHEDYPYMTIYDLTGGAPKIVTTSTIFPTGNGRRVSFSTDGKYFILAHNNYPFISIYRTPDPAVTYITNANFTLQKLTPRTTPDTNGFMYDIGAPLTFTDSSLTGKPVVYDNDPANLNTTNILTSTPEISIAGLAPGLYMIQETYVPGDYDLLGYNIFIEITMEFDPVTETWTTVKRLFHDTENEFLYSAEISGFGFDAFYDNELNVHETVYVENFMPDFAAPDLELFIDVDGDFVKGLGTGVGETVNFAINATVPNLLGQFADYTYIVHNEFTGPTLPFLGFDDTGEDYLAGIEVFIWKDGDPATKEPILSGYNVTQNWPGFDVEFDFTTLQSIPKGYDILIEYSAIVNVNVVETLGFTSNAWLEYSDDPNDLMSIEMTELSTVCVRVAGLDDVWKVDGKTKSVEEHWFEKIDGPDELPTGAGYSAAFSPDGTLLAVAHSTSPYITIYNMSSDIPTKIEEPDVLPTGVGQGVTFSPDGTLLVVAHVTSPYVTIYDMSSNIPHKIPNPATLPRGTGYSATFSSDGQYLAIAHTTSPYITVYNMSGGTPLKLANPVLLPTGNAIGVSFSPDNKYLAVTHNNYPYITIYNISNGTLIKTTDFDTPLAGNATPCAFSHNGQYLAITFSVYPYIAIYNMLYSPPSKIDDPDVPPTGISKGVVFSLTDEYLVVTHDTTPYMTIYNMSNGIPVKTANANTLPTGVSLFGPTFNSDNTLLAIPHQNNPYITIYHTPTPAITTYSTLISNAQFALYQLTPRDNPDVNGNMYDIGLPLAFTDTPFGASLYDGDPTNASTFTTLVSDPEIAALGLAPGTYMLRETKAPDGYDRLTYDVFFEITLEYDDTTNEWLYIKKAVKDVNGTFIKASVPPDYITMYDSTDETNEPLYIENFSGDIFPEVGGIGTTVFYLTSLLLTTGLAIFAIKSRKRKTTPAA